MEALWRKAAPIIVVVLVVTWSLAAPGGATATSPGTVEELQTSSLATELEVPEGRAEDLLATQQQAVGIVEQLEAAQGDRFAGVWFNDSTGKFVVPVLSPADAASVESVLEGAGLESSQARTASAGYSWEELEAAQETLDGQLSRLIESDLLQSSLDPVHNSVRLLVAKDAGEADLGAVRARIAEAPVAVELETAQVDRFQAQSYACDGQYHLCDKPLRGGVQIEPSEGGSSCTAGFRAVGKAFGTHFLLTAGHCVQYARYWRSQDFAGDFMYIGEVTESSFPGGDWAKINAAGHAWDESGSWPGAVVYWGGSQNIPINFESPSYVGESVCHSGAGTGSSCGTVTSIDRTVVFEGGNTVNGLTEVQGWCAWHGDSGGPVWNGNTAVGLLSGGEPSPPCGGGVGYYSEVTEADEAMGVTVGSRANIPPAAITGEGKDVHPQPREAFVTGTVDPNGLSTSYHFDYGPTTGYGSSSPNTEISGGWQQQGASANLTGLLPAATYHYRLAASNAAGTGYGSDQTFSTPPVPPVVSTGAARPLTATSESLVGSVGPENSETTWYFEYGPTAAYGLRSPEHQLGASMAIAEVSAVLAGLEFGQNYHYRLVAQNVAGVTRGADRTFTTGWLPSAVPALEQPVQTSGLTDVSCVSETACVGVGTSAHPSEPESANGMGAVWNGSEWTVKRLPMPAESSMEDLNSVSCTGPTTCAAFGDYRWKPFYNQPLPMVIRWEAENWTLQSVPSPAGAIAGSFIGSSCADASHCEAVGYVAELQAGEIHDVPLAERWDGTEWVVQAVPPPAGAQFSVLNAVSCASPTACVATGSFETPGVSSGVFAEYWNGSAWTLGSMPMPAGASKPAGILVSCSTATACEAAGTYRTASGGSVPFAERWKGSTWAIQSLPSHGGYAEEVKGISCPSGGSGCEAVGKYTATREGPSAYVAWRYGTSWTIQEPAEEGVAGSLEGISCVAVSECMAVGQVSDESIHRQIGSAETYFLRPPARAVTKNASNVEENGATLNGTVEPNGLATETWFEYGPTASYGSKTAVQQVAASTTAVEESPTIAGLTPGTTYHYRIVAVNAGGTTLGRDASFQTASRPAPPGLATLAVTDPFNGAAVPVSNFKEGWTTLPWASGESPKGEDRPTGWGPVTQYPDVAGASYGPTVTDLGSGTAVEVTMRNSPKAAGRYFSLWLDLPSAPTAQSGYQLVVTANAAGSYTVALVKWNAGASTQLAKASNVAIGEGSPVALADEGGAVSAWIQSGATFVPVLSASDTSFSSGTTAVEGSGSYTRLTNLRFGSLQPGASSMNAALNGLRLDDPLATAESPLSEGGTWAPLAWDFASSHSTGQVPAAGVPGWGAYDPVPDLDGAYWTRASFADTGSGDAVAASLGGRLHAGEHFELLSNMPSPGSMRSGYELRLAFAGPSNICSVRLEKYVAGTATLLASASEGVNPGWRIALVDKGGTVSVWRSASATSEFIQILSAADSTFTGGYAGISGAGGEVRLQNFRAGPLPPF